MATKVRDIVTGAARRLRLVGVGDDLDAPEADDLLVALNDMFSAWPKRGIDAGLEPPYTLNSDWPLEEGHVEGMKALLAVRFAGDSGKGVDAKLAMDAETGWLAVRADYLVPDLMSVDRALWNAPSLRGGYWSWDY